MPRTHPPVLTARVRRLGEVAIALVVGVWTLPAFLMDVSSGLDPSWGMGLHQAWHRQLSFGRDIVYTFGPLGFLVQPVIAYPAQGLAAGWLRIPLFAFVAWFHLTRVRRIVPWWAAVVVSVPLTWACIAPQGFGGDAPGVVLVLALAAGVARLCSERPTIGRRTVAALAVATVVAALVKVDVGMVGAVALLLYLVAAGVAASWSLRAILREAALAAGVQVGTLVALWVVLRQPLRGLPAWLQTSWDVALGHNAAMGLDAGRPWWGAAAVVAIAIVCALTIVAVLPHRWRQRVAAVSFTALMLALAAKQAFLREDAGHVQRLVAFLLALAVALGAAVTGRSRGGAAGIVAGALAAAMVAMALSVNSADGLPFLSPVTGIRSARYLVDLTTSSAERAALVDWGHRSQPTVMKVPPSMVQRIGGRSVHIEPWDASVAWVYRLNWKPLPVFQTYMAYTSRLDELNRAALASASGPDAVLHQSLGLDGRIPRFQSPSANVELLCRFDLVEVGSDWNLFLRAPRSRCGASTALGVADARQGEPVTVPASGAQEFVIARFDGLQPGLAGAVRALVLRPQTLYFRVGGDPLSHRFIVPTQAGAHIIRVPQCLQGRLGSYDTSSYESFTLSPSTAVPAPRGPGYRITFQTIAYSCP